MFTFQFAYVYWLNPNICIWWLCSEVREKYPISPQPNQSLYPTSGSLICASFFTWFIMEDVSWTCKANAKHLWTHGKADLMGPYRFFSLKVKVAQLYPTLCHPMDYTIHGILQARIPEWVAFPFSRGSSQPKDQTQVPRIAGGFFTSWATREAQKCWSG